MFALSTISSKGVTELVPTKLDQLDKQVLRLDSTNDLAFWMTIDCGELKVGATGHTSNSMTGPIKGRGLKGIAKYVYTLYNSVLTVTDLSDPEFEITVRDVHDN